MTDIAQFICDRDGRPAFAVLPIAEYERLVDAADDVAGTRAFDAWQRDRPENFPESIAIKLLAGEHPVKVFREYRGLTQRQLGERAGVNPAEVSKVEDGELQPTIHVLTCFATALDVDTDLLA